MKGGGSRRRMRPDGERTRSVAMSSSRSSRSKPKPRRRRSGSAPANSSGCGTAGAAPRTRGGTSLYCVGSAVQLPTFHAMKAFPPPPSARCGPTRPTRRSGSRRTWRWFAFRADGFHLVARHGDGSKLAGRRPPGHHLQLPRPFEPGSSNGRIDLAGNGAWLSRHVRAQGAERRVRTARVAEAWRDVTSGDTVGAAVTPRRVTILRAGIHSVCTGAGVALRPAAADGSGAGSSRFECGTRWE